MSQVLEAALPELAEMAGVALEDVKDLKALLDVAKKKGTFTEAVNDIKKDLADRFTEMETTVASMRNEYKAGDEEAKNKAAEEANLKTLFDNANPDEQKKVWESMASKFGPVATELALFGNNIEKMLYGKHAKGSETHAIASKLQKVSDVALTMCAVNGGTQSNGDEDFVVNRKSYVKQLERLEKYGFDGVETFKKATALDTATANEGKDFIPTDLSQQIIDMIWLDLRVAPMFERLTMTTPKFEIPQITTRGRAYLVDEAIDPSDYLTNKFTPDGFQTSKMSFNARKLGAQLFWSDEIQEDAQVPLAQIILNKIAQMMSVSIEDAVINGNRTLSSTTLDNAAAAKRWTGTADPRFAWDGLRKSVAAGQMVDSAGTLNLAMFRKVRRTLGKYGLNPNILNWAFNAVSLADILGIDEVLRWRDVQDRATVMTGVLAEIDGIGITFSEFIHNDLNASGLFDNVTTTKTMGMLFRNDSHMFGDRRLVRVETDRSITSQQKVIVSTWRGDFQKVRQGMSTTEAAISYNLPG